MVRRSIVDWVVEVALGVIVDLLSGRVIGPVDGAAVSSCKLLLGLLLASGECLVLGGGLPQDHRLGDRGIGGWHIGPDGGERGLGNVPHGGPLRPWDRLVGVPRVGVGVMGRQTRSSNPVAVHDKLVVGSRVGHHLMLLYLELLRSLMDRGLSLV